MSCLSVSDTIFKSSPGKEAYLRRKRKQKQIVHLGGLPLFGLSTLSIRFVFTLLLFVWALTFRSALAAVPILVPDAEGKFSRLGPPPRPLLRPLPPPLISGTSTWPSSAVPKVKIRIAHSQLGLSISGVDLRKKSFPHGEVKNYQGRKKLGLECRHRRRHRPRNERKHQRRRRRRTKLLASFSSPTGLISLGEKKYRGDLFVLSSQRPDHCDVINEISMEDYISTLLSKEMNSAWPLAALKAQAVAARTYAFHKMQIHKRQGLRLRPSGKTVSEQPHYHLENSERHQVSGHFFDATEKTHQASQQTRGEILLAPGGRLTPIFFHAQCGGRTLRPGQVWKNEVPGYRSAPCTYCYRPQKGHWRYSIGPAKLKKFLAWAKKKKLLPTQTQKGKQDFTLAIKFQSKNYLIKRSWPRRYFGRSKIPSNNYTTQAHRGGGGGLTLVGQGNGHGVGLCQLGALSLARQGMNYKKILAHYFPLHYLDKIY